MVSNCFGMVLPVFDVDTRRNLCRVSGRWMLPTVLQLFSATIAAAYTNVGIDQMFASGNGVRDITIDGQHKVDLQVQSTIFQDQTGLLGTSYEKHGENSLFRWVDNSEHPFSHSYDVFLYPGGDFETNGTHYTEGSPEYPVVEFENCWVRHRSFFSASWNFSVKIVKTTTCSFQTRASTSEGWVDHVATQVTSRIIGLTATHVSRPATAVSVDTRQTFAKDPFATKVEPDPNSPAGYVNFSTSIYRGGLFVGSAAGVQYGTRSDQSGTAWILLQETNPQFPGSGWPRTIAYAVSLYCNKIPADAAAPISTLCLLPRVTASSEFGADPYINTLNNLSLVKWNNRFCQGTGYSTINNSFTEDNQPVPETDVDAIGWYSWQLGTAPAVGTFNNTKCAIVPSSDAAARWRYFISTESASGENLGNEPRFVETRLATSGSPSVTQKVQIDGGSWHDVTSSNDAPYGPFFWNVPE